MVTWDFEPPLIKQHIAVFETEFEAAVNLSVLPYAGYTASLEGRLLGEGCDVFYNFSSNSNRFFNLGWAKGLDRLTGADEVLADMFPSVREHYQSSAGRLISLPYFSAVHATFYNESHLRQAGISAPPETFEELYRHCTIIKSAGITATPYTSYWAKAVTEQAFVNYLLAAGVTPFDRDGSPAFADDPRSVDMMDWWLSMYREKLTQPTILDDVVNREASMMAQGHATFMESQHYWLKAIRTQNGPESSNVVMSYRMPGNVNMALQIGEVIQLGNIGNPAAWDLARFYGHRNPRKVLRSPKSKNRSHVDARFLGRRRGLSCSLSCFFQ
jgi:multiple sugar transport system substrate-binding protein